MNSIELVKHLNDLIQIGNEALNKETTDPSSYTSKGILAIPTVDGELLRSFIDKTKTMLDRHLKKHELYQTIHDDLYKKQFYPNVVSRIISSLKSIASDDEFMKDFDKEHPEEMHNIDNKKVFIVHGHDVSARDEVEQLLWRIGLTPVIMMNEPNKGLTLIEKLDRTTEVGFAVVIYSACDLGRDKNTRKNNPRARQNVIFEHGYLISKLGRARVVALVEDEIETPGDLQGIVYISFGNAKWKQELMREIQAAGYHIDVTKA